MKRTVRRVQMGNGLITEVVCVEGDEAAGPDEGHDGFKALFELLTQLMAAPQLLRNERDCPSEVAMKHDGTRWRLEATALAAQNDAT